MKKTWLFKVYIWGEILPRFIGIIINHCKDPYQPTSLVVSVQPFQLSQRNLFLQETSFSSGPTSSRGLRIF